MRQVSIKPKPVSVLSDRIAFCKYFEHEPRGPGIPIPRNSISKHFPSTFDKRQRAAINDYQYNRASYTFTHKDRLKTLDLFLQKHANQIKRFADVGPGVIRGAPTTFDAAKVLPNSEVFAVDIHNFPKDIEVGRVKHLLHAISKKQLPNPGTWDAIRFANVSMHMSQSDRRRAIVNIWHSLRDGGYLLGAYTSEYQFVLKKVTSPKRGWIEVLPPKLS